MNHFAVLTRYELKKLFQKKILRVTLIVCFLGILFSLLLPLVGDYYVDKVLIDTNYKMHITDQGYRKALDGRAIDQTLLEETIAAYRRVPMDRSPYSLTEEYQTYARPYSEIFNLIRTWTRLEPAAAMNPPFMPLWSRPCATLGTTTTSPREKLHTGSPVWTHWKLLLCMPITTDTGTFWRHF